MAKKKYPSTSGAGEPFAKDNLQLINGIGPGVEKRLNGVGIFTFVQLAEFSPADIAAAVADLFGMSAERIIKQNWMGQARKLSEESMQTGAQVDVESKFESPTAEEHAPAETFSVELQHAKEPEQAPALVAESKPLTLEAAQPVLAGTPHLRDMTITGTESVASRKTLPQEQPFKIHLTLDLAEITVPGDTSLTYKASIYGKSRSSRSGQVIGKVEGTIKPTEKTVIIDVEGNPLPEGIYRLAATVALTLPGTETAEKRGVMAVMDGGRVLVF